MKDNEKILHFSFILTRDKKEERETGREREKKNIMKDKQHRIPGFLSFSYLIDHIRVTDTNEHLSVLTNKVFVYLFSFDWKNREREQVMASNIIHIRDKEKERKLVFSINKE